MVGWCRDPDLPDWAVWPEPWPPGPDAPDQVGDITRRLRLSKDQYEKCCELAEQLVEEPAFKEAVQLVARAAMVAPMIDAEGLEILREGSRRHQTRRSNGMEFVEAKATTTSTNDLGEFKALVATWDRDREGDVIRPGAFAHSINEWREVGRRVPLHWNHIADQIVGDVDPEEMWEDYDSGLEVSGRVDLDTEQGRKIWKSLKAGRLGFSFGYLPTKSRKLEDGGRELLELDVFKVSVTPSPMNNRTRVLSTKSIDLPPELIGTALDPAFSGEIPTKAQIEVEMKAIKAAKAARPIQIATFEC